VTAATESRLTAAEIHRRLAGRWAQVLERLGISPDHLANKHGPCPACGGTKPFRFDDRDGRGTWICTHCGAGDAFALLQLVHRWSFAEARRAVIDAMGGRDRPATPYRVPPPREKPQIAAPTARVQTLLRTSAAPDSVPDVVAYLKSRRLWPLPPACAWLAHVQVEYRRQGEGKTWASEGRFPCLIASVEDMSGEIVTAHVTFIEGGRKLERRDHTGELLPARKILSPLTGRNGCAVRLLPLVGDVLGIAEGIETALAASTLHDGMPVWAALNTSLLGKFEPPPEVRRLLIFADRDAAGLEAAWHLRDSLGERCKVELRLPPARAGDWADELEEKWL